VKPVRHEPSINRSKRKDSANGRLRLFGTGVLLLSSVVVAGSAEAPARIARVRPLASTAPQALAADVTPACPPVKARQLYRFLAGIDACMKPMAAAEVSAELNDPFGQMLSRNAGGAGVWPASISDLQQAIATALPSWAPPRSYLVGEGSQIPASLLDVKGQPVGRDGNRDFRYVLTWGANPSSPVIFLSGVPAGIPGGTPPPFLQVISFDPKKDDFNYYQFINNADVIEGGSNADRRTWSWAGDSTYARKPQTTGQGCFACHLNGGLNMKELTPPWNNWHSPQASVSTLNVPVAMANDSLFQTLTGADNLQTVFQGAMFSYTQQTVKAAIAKDRTVAKPSELLRRLIATTTINFRASQIPSSGSSDISALPNDFFLNDSTFHDVLFLKYQFPDQKTLMIKRADFDQFVKNKQVALVNTNGTPKYIQPGATFFAFFVPAPAYEDTKAIQQLINNKVISDKFAASVLMVDFTNPVFSQPRSSLMTYAAKITTGKADGTDIPNQFAALVTAAAAGTPAVDPAHVAKATPEQQFLYYWNQTDWQAACVTQIDAYLQAVGIRIGTIAGANDYLTLAISRGIQFANDPRLCNLNEMSLLLPTSSLGQIMVQMLPDGTISPLPPAH
jgi:hypothetical protein